MIKLFVVDSVLAGLWCHSVLVFFFLLITLLAIRHFVAEFPQ